MQLMFGFIADYAQHSGGKLSAIGIGVDTIFLRRLPGVHPTMSVVVNMEGTIVENGAKDVTLRMIDADGADVITPIRQRLMFEVQPPSLSRRMQMVFQVNNLRFAKYGDYSIHLAVQGNEVSALSFRVAESPS